MYSMEAWVGCSVCDLNPGGEVKEEEGESATFDPKLLIADDTLHVSGNLKRLRCTPCTYLLD
jgi:hypothetical protein